MPIGESVNSEQREDLVKNALNHVEHLFTEGEKHVSIVTQQKPMMNLRPMSIVATNKRILLHRPGIFSSNFIDFLWEELKEVHMSESLMGANMEFTFENNSVWKLSYMPKTKAKELYRYAQEQEEEWRTKKRARGIEAARASSGASSIVVGQTSSSHMKSKLLELKQLLEEELITQDEYYKKKNELLKEL